ncbi:MAG: hypothetical protein WA667_17300 [Candidatus Nitrosopolaris sp.]
MKAEYLELSKVKKAEPFDFMKEVRKREEYRRASAIKQKLEGLLYRTIAKNLDVNYRNALDNPLDKRVQRIWTGWYKE